jgi:tRNA (cytidine/uridine-2'-O-)-methyltransferase
LVGPLGFEISDRYLKRAGLDYWPYVDLHFHKNWEEFDRFRQQTGGRTIGFSVSGQCNYLDCQFKNDDWLLFGRETTGLSKSILDGCDLTARIQIINSQVRSLNLSVSVSVGLFESYRQLGYLT